MNKKCSRNIILVETIHFLVGLAFGIFPLFRPWVQMAGLVYILDRELYRNPMRWAEKLWWELDPDDAPYRWGLSYYQVVSLREKGSIDMAAHMLGQLVGAIMYEVL